MRIEQIRYSKGGSDTSPQVRLQPGQIVHGKILQLFPANRAHIQLGSFQFIAQLEAPLEQGERYFFQVAEVKDEIHLRVIQQPNVQEENEWQHILQYIGSKHSKGREQFVKELLQSDIPFTKKSLQQVFKLLDNHPQQAKAMHALKIMLYRDWPLTKEIMESMIAYESSTFTKEVDTLYQSIFRPNQVVHSNPALVKQLELLLPEVTKINHIYRPLFDVIMTKEAKQVLQLLQWSHPQVHTNNIQKLVEMSEDERSQTISTPSQMLEYIGIHTSKERQSFQQTLQSISAHSALFQQRMDQFLQTFERSVQLQAIHSSNNMVDAELHQRIQDAFMHLLPTEQWTTTEQILMRQAIPANIDALLQMMIHVKESKVETLKQIMFQLNNLEQNMENKETSKEFIRMIQHVTQNIGLSYEHSVAQEETNHLMHTLKGALMEYMQELGVNAERARPLLQFIQGMQLQTVQETAHMLSVHLQIPAMIGALRSDMLIEFESKKSSSNTIDPDYCRILFNLDLAALKQTLIDMHIQNEQVSFVIYNDFEQIKTIAEEFEPLLKENLRNTGYEVTSIRYQPLHKKKEKENGFVKTFEAKEGFDIKI